MKLAFFWVLTHEGGMMKSLAERPNSFLTLEICNEYLVKPLARSSSHSLTRHTIKLLNTEIYNWSQVSVVRQYTHITDYMYSQTFITQRRNLQYVAASPVIQREKVLLK